MRNVSFMAQTTQVGEMPIPQLTRHLTARLEDFGPGGPKVLDSNQQTGVIVAIFPGHDTEAVLSRLSAEYGVAVEQEGDRAIFCLNPEIPFEDLDYVWGCLFNILY